MALTFVAIATANLSTGTSASISFTSIPATYTDLYLVVSARNNGNGSGQYIQYNSSSSSYSQVRLISDGPTATSPSNTFTSSNFFLAMDNRANASGFGVATIYIIDYQGANNKHTVQSSTNPDRGTSYDFIETDAATWNNTAAITSITLTPESASFAQHTTATLYGIKNTV